MATLTIESYDEVLDAIDNERQQVIIDLFKEYELEPYSQLLDSPRITNHSNIELTTYLEYVLYYNLTDIIDLFIDDMGVVIDDEILASTLILQNTDTYEYLCGLGYTPEEQTLKTAVQMRYSNIVESILSNDCDLIHNIDIDDIECLYNDSNGGDGGDDNFDEEMCETLSVLCNYNIDKHLLHPMLCKLKHMYVSNTNNINNLDIDNLDIEKQDVIFEIINILENYGIDDN